MVTLIGACGGRGSQNACRPVVRPFHPRLELTENDCRAFEPRVRALERAAAALKRRVLVENAAVLDEVQPFPGSKLVENLDQPARTRPLSRRGQTGAFFEDYIYEIFTDEQYDALAAVDWSSDRSYVAPPGVKAVNMRDFFVSQLTDWRLVGESKSPGSGPASLRTNGIGVYQLTFRRESHCLFVDVGVNEKHHEGAGRGIDIGTNRPRSFQGRTVC
jgi:hypothetical protein